METERPGRGLVQESYRHDGSLAQPGSGRPGLSASGYILTIEQTRLPEVLDMQCKGNKGVNYSSKFSGLSKWKDGIAITWINF